MAFSVSSIALLPVTIVASMASNWKEIYPVSAGYQGDSFAAAGSRAANRQVADAPKPLWRRRDAKNAKGR
jgi:hypothetical protein